MIRDLINRVATYLSRNYDGVSERPKDLGADTRWRVEGRTDLPTQRQPREVTR